METPWLSVIVPSHNGERWLGAALNSVAEQTEPGIEVIVIDGSDDDHCPEITKSFGDKLRLRVYRRPDLRSWTAKTNFGVAEARAAHVCMLHQDDLWLPHRSAAVRKWLAARPGGVMHLHPVHIIDEAGNRRGLWRCPLPAGDAPVPDRLLLERLLVQNFISIPSPVIRRDAFLRVGGLDDELWYTADWDLYLKLAAVGDVCYRREALACFRIHRQSLTVSGSGSSDAFQRQMETVLDRHSVRLGAVSQKGTDPALRVARLSVAMNAALAAANRGKLVGLIKVVIGLLGLGPAGIRRYFRDSRIVERVYPRLRARLAGGF